MMTAEACDTAVKGVAIANYNMPRIWADLEVSSEFEARKAGVDAFNAANKFKKRGISMVCRLRIY
jgi:xanthine dehydrogenase/oxidase